MANLTVSFKFTPDSPWLPWQQNFGQMGYNSASARDICEIFVSIGGVLGVGPSNTANQILPQPTLGAMATKFETKIEK